jgi:uncharacterized protein (DUF885 family)
MDLRSGLLPVLATFVLACGCSPGTDDKPERHDAAETGSPAPDALHALFEDEWQSRLARDPLFASEMGVDRYNDRLPVDTAEDHARYLEEDRAFLERLAAIDEASLGADDQLNHELFEFIVGSRATLAEHRPWLVPILSDSGFHIEVQRMYEAMPFEAVADYETYLARLRQLGPFFDQNIAHMREGLLLGITQPKAILEGIEASITGPIVEDPAESIYFTPFAALPRHFSDQDRERLRSEASGVIESVVIPAYERFHRFFVDEYMPGARDTLGASAMPNGAEWYADLVRYYTTLDDATPDGIHATGLAEVARIRAEMDQIIQEVEFSGTFAEFSTFLRTDPRFYVEDPEDLLKEAAWIAKRIDGQMPAFFGKIPRLPYGVMAVPADIAPNYTTGRYWGAPIGGRRGGYYLVNTYALDKRPLYELAALTAHEAAPGHHHQLALRQEIAGVPEFRRAFYPHAFGEGWGLYSEKLGIELGIYDTAYDHFGRLSYEMWRAARLVIDTGIHAQGWSRDAALAYLADNTALSLHNVRTEVDRYIAWPGQALAYKMGELKILELRRRAEDALGAKFDIREFHDLVLSTGGVTLNVLDRQVDDWIRSASP